MNKTKEGREKKVSEMNRIDYTIHYFFFIIIVSNYKEWMKLRMSRKTTQWWWWCWWWQQGIEDNFFSYWKQIARAKEREFLILVVCLIKEWKWRLKERKKKFFFAGPSRADHQTLLNLWFNAKFQKQKLQLERRKSL